MSPMYSDLESVVYSWQARPIFRPWQYFEHESKLVFNVLNTGYATTTMNKISAGRRNTYPIATLFLLFIPKTLINR